MEDRGVHLDTRNGDLTVASSLIRRIEIDGGAIRIEVQHRKITPGHAAEHDSLIKLVAVRLGDETGRKVLLRNIRTPKSVEVKQWKAKLNAEQEQTLNEIVKILKNRVENEDKKPHDASGMPKPHAPGEDERRVVNDEFKPHHKEL